MRNPWLKKNPWLSMWLSGANSVAGRARARTAAQARRQVNAAVSEVTRANLKLWSEAFRIPGSVSQPRRKRKR